MEKPSIEIMHIAEFKRDLPFSEDGWERFICLGIKICFYI